MASPETQMTPEEIEQLKIFLAVVLLIPALFLARFLLSMILPRSILKMLFRKKQGYGKKSRALEKKKRPFDD